MKTFRFFIVPAAALLLVGVVCAQENDPAQNEQVVYGSLTDSEDFRPFGRILLTDTLVVTERPEPANTRRRQPMAIRGNEKVAAFLDSVFIKDIIGIDPQKISKIDLVRDTVIRINGVRYEGMIALKYKEPANLISLREVAEEYLKEVKYRDVIFEINDLFITNKKSIDDYKIDRDYILDVTWIKSSDFGYMSGQHNFVIVRILMKTEENLRKAERIRWK